MLTEWLETNFKGAGRHCPSRILFNFPFHAVLRQVNIMLLMIDHNENVETNDENFLDAIASSIVCTKIQPGIF